MIVGSGQFTGQTLLGQIRGGVVHRYGGLLTVVHSPPILRATQPALELGRDRLEGGVETVRAGLGPHDRALTARGDLHPLAALALTTIALVEEFHIEQE